MSDEQKPKIKGCTGNEFVSTPPGPPADAAPTTGQSTPPTTPPGPPADAAPTV